MKHTRVLLLAVVILIGVTAAAFASAPTVKVDVTGTPAFGATITAKATVTITDGSTLQGLKWTQLSGAPVTLANAITDTVTISLPDRKTYRNELAKVLEEPPIPVSGTYEGGLQNRFGVTAVAPLALEDAGATKLNVEVTTSSGVYNTVATIATPLPWTTATGVRNVPILLPVIAQSKEQATYNWTLTVPTGSSATLTDPTSRFPEFTPDVAGTYTLSITDLSTGKPQTFAVHAGTWKGIITGQDANGRPTVDAECTSCHVKNTPHFDLFTPWKASGHAEIFQQNVNTANNHYSGACLGCHTVGYNTPPVKNNGIDDQPDFQALLQSGLIEHAAPGNYDKMVTQFPKSIRFANIQCENCHGPQNSLAHKNGDESRMSLSSDVCGSCHGEPARHGRYQQWQTSGHANYEVARSEGTSGDCAKCHSAQGFIQWQDNNFSTAALNITWTTDDVHPQTCAACHDPHDVGTTSGGPTTNAKVRVMGTTPKTLGGYTVSDVGTAAICITCHNGRRDLRDDAHFTTSDAARAPHEGPQGDIVMGYNLYFTTVGVKGFHGQVEDACVTCHMEKTPPPAELSYQLGGTNHTFTADKGICAKCHNTITADAVQAKVSQKLTDLKAQIENAIFNTMATQIRLGNQIDLNGTKIKSTSEIATLTFVSSHGSQGINVVLKNGKNLGDMALTTVKVVRPAGPSVAIYSVADPSIPKSGWNYFMVTADKSKGVHNPAFVNSALDVATFALKNYNANPAAVPGGGSNAALGGGLGTGAGAVACKTSYVYWSDIAGHTPGQNGSQWRTDVVTRNLSGDNASLRFVLHLSAGTDLEYTGAVPGAGQASFEDIVALMGGTSAIGSLEVCSDKPLLITSRNFNQADAGTFGQNLDGRVADLGYNAGQTVNLIGLRQKTDKFRSNISVTNGGSTEAQVSITLFDAKGTSLNTYTLTVPAGKVINDGEVFKNHANAPDVDWGFATVTVLKGSNVLTAGSLIDVKTNDPSTIPPKQ